MRVVIAGGGVSGLAAAHYILRHPRKSSVTKVVVVEASERVGGWIQSTTLDDGVTYEHGPRTVRPAGPAGLNTLALISDIGLENSVKPIPFGHPTTKNRMLYVDGRICPLPNSLGSLFKIMAPFKRPHILSGVKELTTPSRTCDDCSAYELMERRFGRDYAEYLIDPMTRGICAGDAREISADAFVLGPVFRREQADGGLFKSLLKSKLGLSKYKVPTDLIESSSLARRAQAEKWGIWSLEGGLSGLTDALRASVEERGADVVTGQPIKSVELAGSKAIVNGEEFDHAFISVSATAAAGMLKGQDQLTSLLKTIPYVDVGVVNVEYEGRLELPCGPGFGILVPSSQTGIKVLGVIFDTCMFPQGERTIFTVMMGGRWFQSLFGQNPSEEDLTVIAVEHIQMMLGINQNPVRICTKIHRDAIAQYTVGHTARLKQMRNIIESESLPLSLIGSAYDGVGINDAIVSAKKGVNSLMGTDIELTPEEEAIARKAMGSAQA